MNFVNVIIAGALILPLVFSLLTPSCRLVGNKKSLVSLHLSTVTRYEELKVPTLKGIALHDITPNIKGIIEASGVSDGVVTIISRHTTSGITINEMESRLIDDVRQFLLKLAPPDYPYLHNDLHLRKGPPGWPGGDEAWRAQEPINCHSHLLAMIMGTSESIPIHKGNLMIGTWQSIILIDMDGPRTRSVGVQITGTKEVS